MTLVAYYATSDDPADYTVHRVTDGDSATTAREWFVDTRQLAQHGDVVLDTDIDGPAIALLEKHKGFARRDASGLARTLPAELDDMNRAQLLSTREGNAIKEEEVGKSGGLVQDLELNKLRKEVEQAADRDVLSDDDPDPGVDAAVKQAVKGMTDKGYTIYDTGAPSNLARGSGGADEGGPHAAGEDEEGA
jgi:hypothetical protein